MKARGLEILEHQERSLTEAEAKEFYSHSADEPYFDGLIKLMTSGPSHVLVITKTGTGRHRKRRRRRRPHALTPCVCVPR